MKMKKRFLSILLSLVLMLGLLPGMSLTAYAAMLTVTGGGNGGNGNGTNGKAVNGKIKGTTARHGTDSSNTSDLSGVTNAITSNEKYVYIEGSTHEHSFTYSADGATITATCSDTSCALHSTPATLTLSAANATYTGSAYTGASLDLTAWTAAGLVAPTIEYAGRGDTSYTKSTTAPTDKGTYTASITVDTDKTATADFTISPVALR